MLQFHQQNPEIKLLDENKPNYFLSAANQRIFSSEIFYLELKCKDNKWVIDCNEAFYDRLHETNWYSIGSKLFFAIEPVT
jgi:hypothetical protein